MKVEKKKKKKKNQYGSIFLATCWNLSQKSGDLNFFLFFFPPPLKIWRIWVFFFSRKNLFCSLKSYFSGQKHRLQSVFFSFQKHYLAKLANYCWQKAFYTLITPLFFFLFFSNRICKK